MLILYVSTREYDQKSESVIIRVRSVRRGEHITLRPNEAIIAQEFDYDDEEYLRKPPKLDDIKLEDKHA